MIYKAIYRSWGRQETAAMCQGDRLTSLISAGPPCQADRGKLFIHKLKWDMPSYHSYCIQRLIIYGACGQRPNNEFGLTLASMGTGYKDTLAHSTGLCILPFTANMVDLIQLEPVLIRGAFTVPFWCCTPACDPTSVSKMRWCMSSETEI